MHENPATRHFGCARPPCNPRGVGKAYTGAVSGALTKDIEAGATFSADIKVDNIFPLKFTCPMCGGNCTITVPVVTKTVTFALPPCPIKAASIDQKFNFTLPSASPAPVKIGFSGKVTAVDKDGNSLADVDVTGDVTPTAVVVEAQDA